MTEANTLERHEFRAEIQQLLHILVHSLYTEREIFLRELISNASDALNRLRFETVSAEGAEIFQPDAEMAIRISVDSENRTLTVSDSGIGMTREEAMDSLGTIAKSGAAAFLKALQEQKGSEIIGQFGVGFYSVFMVADKVEVISRSFRPDAEAVRWVAEGGNSYEVSAAEKETRGTEVILHLREDSDEFAQEWRVKSIVKKHSNFIGFPIYVDGEIANQQSAIWRKRPKDVKAEEYEEFYKQLTFATEAPLSHLHISTEVPVDIHAVLYIPAERERTLNRIRQQSEGVRLYSRKILIQESNKELLPTYLRFVDGVVDSEDLPLSVSRETVQSNRVLQQLRQALTGRITKEVERLATEDEAKYLTFWKNFGVFIKEGVATDFRAQEELAKLLRFHSTYTEGEAVTSLAAYKLRMGSDQNEIYYILADDLNVARRSPHLDPFKARGMEVLLLTDPVDGFVVNSLRAFDGSSLRNADDPLLELPPLPEVENSDTTADATTGEAFGALVARMKTVLGSRVTDVVESNRLTDNPVRLAVAEGGMGQELERMRRLMGEDESLTSAPRRLELNRKHPLVKELAAMASASEAPAVLDVAIEHLYDSALLMEGVHPNPAEMGPRIQQLLTLAMKK
jgi:HSP90 family molecular chaperone